MGDAIGCFVQINPVLAVHVDAVAEVLECLRSAHLGISWSGGNTGSDSAIGMVGTW
jgi:hypothetical protein